MRLYFGVERWDFSLSVFILGLCDIFITPWVMVNMIATAVEVSVE